MDNISDFQTIYYVYVDLYPQDCRVKGTYIDFIRKKFLYFSKEVGIDEHPIGIIRGAARNTSLPLHSKVFISSSSKISRDLVRKSYSITRKPSESDGIVIPFTKSKAFVTKQADILLECISKNIFYLIFIDNYTNVSITDQQYEMVVSRVLSDCDIPVTDSDVFYKNYKFPIHFVPDVKEYRDILAGNDEDYVFDNELIIETDNTVSVETLDLWSRMTKDKDLLEKSILNSNALNYPFTLFQLLDRAPFRFCLWSDKMRYFLQGLGIYNLYQFPSDRNISPEDWNMYQKWLMHQLGVDEKGGFTDAKISHSIADIIKVKYAVAPNIVSVQVKLGDFAE